MDFTLLYLMKLMQYANNVAALLGLLAYTTLSSINYCQKSMALNSFTIFLSSVSFLRSAGLEFETYAESVVEVFDPEAKEASRLFKQKFLVVLYSCH